MILEETNYCEQMQQVVEPYLEARKKVLWIQREPGNNIYCERYLADKPKGIVMISHGFTESAEKYKEVIYYFVKMHYHVYLPEYCGHGRSYRLVEISSRVHIDDYQRYLDDFFEVVKKAKEENPELPMILYGHSMGGGLGAAQAAQHPEIFKKVILSSPMIRPQTGNIPWTVAKDLSFGACKKGNGTDSVAGQEPYQGRENYENGSSASRVRFEYYQDKKEKEVLFQTNHPSYSWLYQAVRLNHYLQHQAWKTIEAPVLIFQAEQEHLVSNAEQIRFIEKLVRRRPGSCKLIMVPETKHEIYGSNSRILKGYWKKIFTFIEEKER